jgi:hypothetical protein
MMSSPENLLAMNLLPMNANPFRLEAGGTLGAPGTRKIAAYLAIHREMTLLRARTLMLGR